MDLFESPGGGRSVGEAEAQCDLKKQNIAMMV